jgi:hypothetical protein
MRRILTLIGFLEVYAFLLVLLALPGGVRTDEAKYLLSIPYPHPPLIRTIVSWGTSFPMHELLVRFVFATVVVQSAWIVWDLGRVLTRPRRLALALAWLLSSAVVLQGGTVMLAPITAVFGLLFLTTSLSPEPVSLRTAPFLAILWLIGLLSAFQVALYLPLVWSSIRRAGITRIGTAIYVFLPLVVLGIYALSNPLTLASMTIVTGAAPLQYSERLLQAGAAWLIALSGVGSLVGTVGIVIGDRRGLLLSSVLVGLYIILSPQGYYAILLTPLLLGGVFLLFCRRRIEPQVFAPLSVVMTLVLVLTFPPPMHATPARDTLAVIRERGKTAPIIIDGFFGHEWEYWSPVPVMRFTQDLRSQIEDGAQAIICTKRTCEEDIDADRWEPLAGMPVEVWARK